MKKISFLLTCILLLDLLSTSALGYSTSHPNTHINTGDYAYDIVEIAKTQVGYQETGVNETKYTQWFRNKQTGEGWCAIFISWCANQAEIPTSIIAQTASPSVAYGTPTYDFGEYNPGPGDIVYVDNSGSKKYDHVGLVYDTDSSYIYTIEGNWGGGSTLVSKVKYDKQTGVNIYEDSAKIVLYGRPNYGTHTHSYSQTYEAIHPHKVFMVCSCGDYYYTGQVTVMTSCNQCVHTHTYKGASYEAIHPHREYSLCSCGETKLTGNTGTEIEREAIHPHRKFYVCKVSNCSYNNQYTGELGYTTKYEETYPYKEIIVCSVTSCSYNNTYTGNNALPRNVKITSDITTIETNKAVRFNFTVENANYWYFVVKKDGENKAIELVTGKYNYSYTFAEEGTYTVELQAANDYGWSTNALSITVTEPKKPTVKVTGDKININVGETINYNFTVENANYWYFVVKKGDEVIRNELMTRKYECSHTFDDAGEYLVEIQAANDVGWTVYTVGATVVEPVPEKLTSSTVQYVDDVANVYTEFYDISDSHKIIVAGYNSDKLVCISILPADISKGYQTATLKGKIDEVRVFIWNKSDTLSPLCRKEIILLTDFTTE